MSTQSTITPISIEIKWIPFGCLANQVVEVEYIYTKGEAGFMKLIYIMQCKVGCILCIFAKKRKTHPFGMWVEYME